MTDQGHSDLPDDFSVRLRDAMEAMNLPPAGLAAALALPEPQINRWLVGQLDPTSHQLDVLAETLEVSVDWLEHGVGEGPAVPFEEKRHAYRAESGWAFRREPPDGARDYGNANIWSFSPDIATLVREVLQNVLDVRRESPAFARFSLVELDGTDLDRFLDALGWETLGAHVEDAAKQDQKLALVLQEGLARLRESQSLLLLRIEDSNTTGLTGAETGTGSHFAALCRNNLDSNKAAGAGGAFGLGKAVLWRMSELSTVLFNSDLATEEASEGNRWSNRVIGRTELGWHEAEGSAFAGPGWFGSIHDEGETDVALSFWGNEALVHDLHLTRATGSSGTSVLIVGFVDPSTDELRHPDYIIDEIKRAAARNFWPALESNGLVAEVQTTRGRETTSTAIVEADVFEPELVEAFRRYSEGDLDDELDAAGAVVARQVTLSIPARRDGSHGPVEHDALLLVRRAEENSASSSVNQIVYLRGAEMIVMRETLASAGIGARPFHAAVLCGAAAEDGAAAELAEEFLRSAEPPAHNRWELTPDVRLKYKQGGGAAITTFSRDVKGIIRELIAPAAKDMSDGPQDLKDLLRIHVPNPEASPRKPRLAAAGEMIDGAWKVTGTIRVKPSPDHEWTMKPVLRFSEEAGRGVMVRWETLEPIGGCDIDNGTLRMPPGVKEARFTAVSDPASHVVAIEESAVSVELSKVQRVPVDGNGGSE